MQKGKPCNTFSKDSPSRGKPKGHKSTKNRHWTDTTNLPLWNAPFSDNYETALHLPKLALSIE